MITHAFIERPNRMNLNTDEIRLVLWPWGRDVTNSVSAIRHAENGTDLATMAEDVINGRVNGCAEILDAFAWRSHEIPIGHHQQLARLHPECPALRQAFCARPDATAEQLDEWADDTRFAIALAHNPNTGRRTIDRLIRKVPPGSRAFSELMPCASMSLLEEFVPNHDCIMLDSLVGYRSDNPNVLSKLASHPHSRVRCAVAANPATRMDTIHEMALQDEDASVLAQVVKRLKNRRILDRLANRLCDVKSELLAREILKNPHSSETAKTVAVMFMAA